MRIVTTALTVAALCTFAALACAQAPAKPADKPKPAPDVLEFMNGDQLTGKLESAAGGNVVFKSDMAGELTVSFAKIKEVRMGSENEKFAVLRKGDVIGKVQQPEGAIHIADNQVVVTTVPGGPKQFVPVKNVDVLVNEAEFDKLNDHKARFRDGWNGSINGGATLARGTESSTNFTAGLNLVRAIPTVSWLPQRNRTTFNLQETYGKNTSPGAIPQTVPPTPTVVTLNSIFHADAERDEYLHPRFYALVDSSFDHNYDQGLQFQQLYGAGLGWTPIKDPKQELDVKIDFHYEKQQFILTPVNGAVIAPPSTNTNLIGSTISETYNRTLPRKIVFTETADILPAYNDEDAYSANATASLHIPVFKRLNASFSTTDNFLNNPVPGYQKNSYQLVTGIAYSLH